MPTLFQVFANDLNVPTTTFICSAVTDSTGASGDSARDSGTTTVTFFVTNNGSILAAQVATALIADYNGGVLANHITAAGLPPPTSINGVTAVDNNKNNNSNNNGLSSGAVAGIVVGSVVGCIILSLLTAFYFRRSCSKNDGTISREPALQPTTYQVRANNQVKETELVTRQANLAAQPTDHVSSDDMTTSDHSIAPENDRI